MIRLRLDHLMASGDVPKDGKGAAGGGRGDRGRDLDGRSGADARAARGAAARLPAGAGGRPRPAAERRRGERDVYKRQIQKLVRIGYLNLNKKTQILTPESLGEMVFEVVYLSLIHI